MLLYACNIMYTASLCLKQNAFELCSQPADVTVRGIQDVCIIQSHFI